MSQTSEPPISTPPTPAPESGDDHLAHLHKMSTTAGLGSTDYVEVNPTAIVAVVLGIVSAVVLFNVPLLLIIPAAGIVTAILAFRQIARSNGTQTGALLAVIAILLSLLFGGILGARVLSERRAAGQNKADLANLVIDFRDKLKAGDYTGMYGLFDKRFQERVKPEQFADMMKLISTNTELYGKIKSVMLPGLPPDAPKGYRWNGLAEFIEEEGTGDTLATAQLI